jgi:hypothetical protein
MCSGDEYEGMFFSIDPMEFKFLILANPRHRSTTHSEIKYLNEDLIRLDFSQIVHVRILNRNAKSLNKAEFQTDVDISKKSSLNPKKDLIK